MALFSEDKKKEKKEKPVKAALSSPVAVSVFPEVLVRPMVTEKAHAASLLGQYAFFVRTDATKAQVKRAVETAYGVHVKNVSTVQVKPKKRVRGNQVGHTRRMKKAIVSLAKGESITLFEGA